MLCYPEMRISMLVKSIKQIIFLESGNYSTVDDLLYEYVVVEYVKLYRPALVLGRFIYL